MGSKIQLCNLYCTTRFVNTQMAEEMGLDNIFIFGMTVEEVQKVEKAGYDAWAYYNSNVELKQARYEIPSCRAKCLEQLAELHISLIFTFR